MVKGKPLIPLALVGLALVVATIYDRLLPLEQNATGETQDAFISYVEFANILNNSREGEQVEFVTLSHPPFEGYCYRQNKCVMSVKVSGRHHESFVLMPEADRNVVFESLQRQDIPIVCIN
jgi:hypothetical protein